MKQKTWWQYPAIGGSTCSPYHGVSQASGTRLLLWLWDFYTYGLCALVRSMEGGKFYRIYRLYYIAFVWSKCLEPWKIHHLWMIFPFKHPSIGDLPATFDSQRAMSVQCSPGFHPGRFYTRNRGRGNLLVPWPLSPKIQTRTTNTRY